MNNIDNQVIETDINAITTRSQFIETLQKWVIIDSQLKIINEKTKKLRDMKNTMTEKLSQYKSKDNIDNTIKITDGELRFYEKKEYSPLTFGYVEKSLGKIISDKTQLDYVIKYLKENREITTSIDIKRKQKNIENKI
jgi:DNA primase catalytic subunit